jgi:hypothetical protein
MAKKLLALMLMLMFGLGPAALAQDKANSSPPVQDWQGLRNLKPGKEIVIHTRKGKIFEGKFADLKGSTLGLALGFNVFDFDQSDIEAVHEKPSRRKARIVGAIIGTLAGAIIAAGLTVKFEENQTGPQESAGFGVGIVGMTGGGALGYYIGRRLDDKRKGKLLYKSR